MKRKMMSLLLAATLITGSLTGCGSKSADAGRKEGTADTGTEEVSADTGAGEKQEAESGAKKDVKLTIMVDCPTDPWHEQIVQMVMDKFPDYDITSKTWSEATVEQTVKTAFAADQAIDVVLYWPTYMKKFEGTGIPMDLTNYLNEDEAWKSSFVDGALEVGTTDEGILALPMATAYPLLQVNRSIFEEAGVEVAETMTWDEFAAACEKIKAIGKTPIAVQKDWAGWFVRNAYLQCWKDETELDSFIAGNISFKDERAVKAMDRIADLYLKDYVYPRGKEAVTTSADDAMAAFLNQDAAIFCNVTGNATNVANQVGDKFKIGVISWPGMAGTEDMNKLLGSASGYMVMSNTKFPEEAVEVLKYLTGDEVQQVMADAGAVVTNKNVVVADENYKLYSKDANKVYPDEVINLSSEIFDNMVYNQPSNYLYNGAAALDELEALREAAASK